MDSEKSINLFQIKKSIGHLIIYRAIIIFFMNWLTIFQHYYYA